METGLTDRFAAAAAPGMPTAFVPGGDAPNPEGEGADAVAPGDTGGGGAPADAPAWPDDAVESAFLAEAKERGEVLAPPKPAEEAGDEDEGKAMPAIGELTAKIPPHVREALEDLFRAKFVRVVRVPKKVLRV